VGKEASSKDREEKRRGEKRRGEKAEKRGEHVVKTEKRREESM